MSNPFDEVATRINGDDVTADWWNALKTAGQALANQITMQIIGTSAAPSLITAAGGITSGSTYSSATIRQYIKGSGGAVTVTANPQIEAPTVDGQELTLICVDDVNTVTLADGTGLGLNGPITLRNGTMLTLIGDLSAAIWREKARNQ